MEETNAPAEQGIFAVSNKSAREAIQRLLDGYNGYYDVAKTNVTGCWLAQKATNKGPSKGVGETQSYWSQDRILCPSSSI
jgi:hypothetical protein